jgi:hypothetical protein
MVGEVQDIDEAIFQPSPVGIRDAGVSLRDDQKKALN